VQQSSSVSFKLRKNYLYICMGLFFISISDTQGEKLFLNNFWNVNWSEVKIRQILYSNRFLEK